jgi:AraC family transcriptional regulator, regulatory protein of adaptative response / DNA-3-methyladenine glycosylase II
MSHAAMYARLLESDASCNGRFFTGVLTTGIYCLPACKARKPKPDNVEFFPTCEAARAAGLRPCKKCRPDDFARGADPVLEDIECLVAEMRSKPASFPDVRAVVRRSGFGATRLFELFRQHFQTTPADLLLRARLDAAKQMLTGGDAGLLEIASASGFESLSVLHEHFRELNGLTPASYRALRDANEFTLMLPENYPLGYLRRALTRDAQSLTEQMDNDRYTTAIQFSGGPGTLVLTLAPTSIGVQQIGGTALEAHAIVAGILGLDQPAAAFARLARKLGLGRLVAGRTNLRIAQTPSVFDGLVWSIIGQQINFSFASVLKRRLVERAGVKLESGLYAPPTPAAVAKIEPRELAPLQFSRSKAEYLVGAARRIVEGKLNLTALRAMSATRAERTLLSLHGLGPWSVNYLMMRALGFPDCVPLGDTGVTSGLQSLLELEERPDIDATRRLTAVFSPYRSLATAHLWQLNQPIPT